MSERKLKTYMKIAMEISNLSYCKRRKVGAIIVKEDFSQILSEGYNGTPYGFDNNCEDEEFKTKGLVIHAETNAILKLSRNTNTTENTMMLVTTAPCIRCAANIIQSGIKKVIYLDSYKNREGVDLLLENGVEVEEYNF